MRGIRTECRGGTDICVNEREWGQMVGMKWVGMVRGMRPKGGVEVGKLGIYRIWARLVRNFNMALLGR